MIEPTITTKEQRKALQRIFERHTFPNLTYLQFRRTVKIAFDDCLMVPVPSCNMWLGVELDGYTHS